MVESNAPMLTSLLWCIQHNNASWGEPGSFPTLSKSKTMPNKTLTPEVNVKFMNVVIMACRILLGIGNDTI